MNKPELQIIRYISVYSVFSTEKKKKKKRIKLPCTVFLQDVNDHGSSISFDLEDQLKLGKKLE